MANFSKDTVLDMLKDIKFQLWLNDIPSPTVPEYVEHHERITELIKFVDKLIMNVAKEGAEQECR